MGREKETQYRLLVGERMAATFVGIGITSINEGYTSFFCKCHDSDLHWLVQFGSTDNSFALTALVKMGIIGKGQINLDIIMGIVWLCTFSFLKVVRV